MTLSVPSRRGFIAGLGAFFCTAPAIVRATSLMPVRALDDGFGMEYTALYLSEEAAFKEELLALLKVRMDKSYKVLRENLTRSLYGGGTFNIPTVADDKPYLLREWASPVIFNFSRLDNPNRSE